MGILREFLAIQLDIDKLTFRKVLPQKLNKFYYNVYICKVKCENCDYIKPEYQVCLGIGVRCIFYKKHSKIDNKFGVLPIGILK